MSHTNAAFQPTPRAVKRASKPPADFDHSVDAKRTKDRSSGQQWQRTDKRQQWQDKVEF